MKVELVTLHRVRNFGSLLQTYATQTVVEKMGAEVEVCDYVPQGLTVSHGVFGIKRTGNPIKDFARLGVAAVTFSIQQSMVSRFLKGYIHLSECRYQCYAQLKAQPPAADIYLSGSDQIWNTQNDNLPEDIRGYYLDFGSDSCKRIAYASSFGKTEFAQEEANEVKKYLERFEAISVREDTAVTMAQKLGMESVCHVLDPTFLLRPSEWREFLAKSPKKEKRKEPYIFVYNLNRNLPLERLANRYSKQTGWQIINFADTLQIMKGAKNKFFNDPFDFVGLISGAQMVITDSFHETAFSINFERQFVAFRAPRFNSRLESILRLTGLEERLLPADVDVDQIQLQPIDYKIVTAIIEKQRDKSFAFLKEALGKGD